MCVMLASLYAKWLQQNCETKKHYKKLARANKDGKFNKGNSENVGPIRAIIELQGAPDWEIPSVSTF